MSPPRRGHAMRLGALLVALYPESWRARYGDEMRALLEDDPPGVRGLATLLTGAADAHLRPQRSWTRGAAATSAMRTAVGGLFACWMLVAVAGVGFAKETEGLSPVEAAHPLMGAAHAAIGAGALLGAAAVAFGGLPLLGQALGTAIRRRDRSLTLLLAMPALAVTSFAAVAAFLLAVAPARGAGFPAPFVIGILAPLTLAGLACALACALAPKAVLRRAEPTARSLRRACWAGQALAAAACLVTGGLMLYVAELWANSTALGAEASGPFGASARATLCMALAGAVAGCALALLAAARARRAALATA